MVLQRTIKHRESDSKMKKLITVVATAAFAFSMVMPANAQNTVMYSRNAYDVCMTPDMNWINFCNGLVQGYAEMAILSGVACIPNGTTRTTLVTIFTDRLPITQAYRRNDPALVAAMEVFRVVYACR